MIRGNILIRDDIAIMISAQRYDEMVAPYDEYILREMNGGGIHTCGKFNHLTKSFLKLPSISCLDLGNPEMNDIDEIYKLAKNRKVPLVRIEVPVSQLLSGKVLDRFPTGVVLVHRTFSLIEAKRVMSSYLKNCE